MPEEKFIRKDPEIDEISLVGAGMNGVPIHMLKDKDDDEIIDILLEKDVIDEEDLEKVMIRRGTTETAQSQQYSPHAHEYTVRMNDEGGFMDGGTSRNDGHAHEISADSFNRGSTETTEGDHSHSLRLNKAKGDVGEDTGATARRLIQDLMDSGMTQEEIGDQVDRAAKTIANIMAEDIKNPPQSLIDKLRGISKSKAEGGSTVADQNDDDQKDQPEDDEPVTKDQDGSEDDVQKGDEDLRKELEQMRKRNEELAEQVEELSKTAQTEREKRLQKEYEELVKEDYKTLPGEVSENAKMLKEIDEKLSEDTADMVKEKLRTATEQLEQAGILEKEFGENGQEGGSAFDKATEKAKKLVEEGEFDSITKARARIWKTHPELAKQADKEGSR